MAKILPAGSNVNLNLGEDPFDKLLKTIQVASQAQGVYNAAVLQSERREAIQTTKFQTIMANSFTGMDTSDLNSITNHKDVLTGMKDKFLLENPGLSDDINLFYGTALKTQFQPAIDAHTDFADLKYKIEARSDALNLKILDLKDDFSGNPLSYDGPYSEFMAEQKEIAELIVQYGQKSEGFNAFFPDDVLDFNIDIEGLRGVVKQLPKLLKGNVDDGTQKLISEYMDGEMTSTAFNELYDASNAVTIGPLTIESNSLIQENKTNKTNYDNILEYQANMSSGKFDNIDADTGVGRNRRERNILSDEKVNSSTEYNYYKDGQLYFKGTDTQFKKYIEKQTKLIENDIKIKDLEYQKNSKSLGNYSDASGTGTSSSTQILGNQSWDEYFGKDTEDDINLLDGEKVIDNDDGSENKNIPKLTEAEINEQKTVEAEESALKFSEKLGGKMLDTLGFSASTEVKKEVIKDDAPAIATKLNVPIEEVKTFDTFAAFSDLDVNNKNIGEAFKKLGMPGKNVFSDYLNANTAVITAAGAVGVATVFDGLVSGENVISKALSFSPKQVDEFIKDKKVMKIFKDLTKGEEKLKKLTKAANKIKLSNPKLYKTQLKAITELKDANKILSNDSIGFISKKFKVTKDKVKFLFNSRNKNSITGVLKYTNAANKTLAPVWKATKTGYLKYATPWRISTNVAEALGADSTFANVVSGVVGVYTSQEFDERLGKFLKKPSTKSALKKYLATKLVKNKTKKALFKFGLNLATKPHPLLALASTAMFVYDGFYVGKYAYDLFTKDEKEMLESMSQEDALKVMNEIEKQAKLVTQNKVK